LLEVSLNNNELKSLKKKNKLDLGYHSSESDLENNSTKKQTLKINWKCKSIEEKEITLENEFYTNIYK